MNTLVFTYGRFNPPTRGHELVFNYVKYFEQASNGHHIVGVSRTQDNKKNPLSVDRKIYWLQTFFPNMNFVPATAEIPSFVQMLEKHSAFYNKLIFVCGQDRQAEYKAILDKYNDELFKFDDYQFVDAGERTLKNDITGVSGTKMRQFIKDNNFDEWINNCPDAYMDYSPLWQELRAALK